MKFCQISTENSGIFIILHFTRNIYHVTIKY